MFANLTAAILLYVIFYHPFYLGVCEINFNSKTGSLEIMHRIFSDDLSARLQEIHNKEFDFSVREGAIDEHLSSYIRDNFILEINGKVRKVEIIGYELENEVILIYGEVRNLTGLRNVRIMNSILMDYTNQQSNIIHFTYKKKTRSFELTHRNTQCEFLNLHEW